MLGWRLWVIMAALSMRARPVDNSKPLPILLAEDVDLKEATSVQRSLPQVSTGMEKEEEEVCWSRPFGAKLAGHMRGTTLARLGTPRHMARNHFPPLSWRFCIISRPPAHRAPVCWCRHPLGIPSSRGFKGLIRRRRC